MDLIMALFERIVRGDYARRFYRNIKQPLFSLNWRLAFDFFFRLYDAKKAFVVFFVMA